MPRAYRPARRTAVGCGPAGRTYVAWPFPPSSARGGRPSSAQTKSRLEVSMSNNRKPSIVFAHGLWADGSCYSKVIDLLQADGYEVISTQNQLNTVEDDAAAVRTS